MSTSPELDRITAASDLTSRAIQHLREGGAAGTNSEAATMLAIACEPLPLGEAARRVGVSRAAMTSLADRLEDIGLAQRQLHREDRRRIHLALTTEGSRAVLNAAIEACA